MAVTDDFVDYVLDQLSRWGGVSVRRMFGGAGLYRDGRIFGLIADNVAYLKVDDSNREDFLKAGSKPFEPYPGKVKTTVRRYYEIPANVLEDPAELAKWAQRSLEITATVSKGDQVGSTVDAHHSWPPPSLPPTT